jgi:UPF0716 protein FxsA
MNVAIWLLIAVLALPLAEIVLFVLVAVWIGFIWALVAVVATSLLGAIMLRVGGGAHVERMSAVLGPQRVTALQSDSAGTMYLLTGILLLIPGFITDVIDLLLLIAPLRRLLGALLLKAFTTSQAKPRDGVVDLDPQDWRQVPDAQLRDERDRR